MWGCSSASFCNNDKKCLHLCLAKSGVIWLEISKSLAIGVFGEPDRVRGGEVGVGEAVETGTRGGSTSLGTLKRTTVTPGAATHGMFLEWRNRTKSFSSI